MGKSLAGVVATATVVASLAAVPVTAGAANGAAARGVDQEFVVLYADGVDAATARAAVAASGGRIVREQAAIGAAYVVSDRVDFVDAAADQSALVGAARNRPVGKAPELTRPKAEDLAALTAAREAAKGSGAAPRSAGSAVHGDDAEPLSDLQWDMQQIRATADGSYAVHRGSRDVLVGIIDTGINSDHPDIQPNLVYSLSRNFTTDIPLVDGPCEEEADGSCHDGPGVDENGHGTHVASTVASPINGLGTAGVAPNVRLVNLRAGQDSGYFFLQPTLDAYIHAADHGIDVINMSYYTDPWLFNCTDNPADTPAQQREQRIVRQATQRAINYARERGVTPISSIGNGATNLNHPEEDNSSPDFPPGNEKERQVDNSCITVPTETDGVISITATGISKRKAYYSNYGTEQADFAAPGGDAYDTPDHTLNIENLVLAAYPRAQAYNNGEVNRDGSPNTPFVVRDCQGDTCAYYQYLQGTSMAAPHAAGVAALVVSKFGTRDSEHGGLTMAPSAVHRQLIASSTPRDCPVTGEYTYIIKREGDPPVTFSHECNGHLYDNGFYGRGIVDALGAVSPEDRLR